MSDPETREIGLGCMRLSTDPPADGRDAVAVIHAALDAGVTLLDTADVYFPDGAGVGHNERLVASALSTWRGDASRVRVATKGGLVRSGGVWRPDGRARHLEAACEASRRALGVERIDLYLLHLPDPKVSFGTSVRALARLKRDGLVRAVGLSNVTVGQIEEASAIVAVEAVQVELSPFQPESFRNGVAEHCVAHGIPLIAHRPLGGAGRQRRLARDPVLGAIAARHQATPSEVVIAWLLDLDPLVVPIPGATRDETARSLARARAIRLDDVDRRELDEHLPAGALLRSPRAERQPPAKAEGEVVILMGSPASGKSTLAQEFTRRGYAGLNRDSIGGRLADLVPRLDEGLRAGGRRFVLDNTYPSRRARNEVIETAWRHGVPVRCVWLKTPLAEAQINAVTRMVERHGRLLSPEEIREVSRAEPNTFGPQALFRYERVLEPPVPDEGFSAIEEVAFERRGPAGRAKAVFLDYPDVLWAGPCPRRGDVEILPGRAEKLGRMAREGWRLLAATWAPAAGGSGVSEPRLRECFAETSRRLGVEIETAICPHPAGPPVCWCRKPLPGLVVAFAIEHGLDLARCLLVGRSRADATLAARVGLELVEPDAFFRD